MRPDYHDDTAAPEEGGQGGAMKGVRSGVHAVPDDNFATT